MGSYYITQCNIEVLANTRTPAASSTQTHMLISSELHWSSTQNLLLPPNLLPCPRPRSSRHSLATLTEKARKLMADLHLSLQTPSLIPSSVADFPLWPLLTLCPHSHWMKWADCSGTCCSRSSCESQTLPLSSPSPFLSVRTQYPETHSIWNLQWPHHSGPQKNFLSGGAQPAYSP